MSVFCRHNRFTVDCPICSKGTVLESGRKSARRPSGAAGPRQKSPAPASAAFSGRYVSAGPYREEGGSTYEVRLERVPGGIRLAEWDGTGLRRRAPVLPAAEVVRLVLAAAGVLEPRDATRLAGALPVRAEASADGGGEEVRSGDGADGEHSGADADAEPPSARTDGEPTDGGAASDRGGTNETAGGTAPSAGPGVSRGRSGDFKDELRVEDVGEGRLRVGRWVLRPGSGWQLQEAPPMLPAARYAEALADAAAHGLVPAASDAGEAARL